MSSVFISYSRRDSDFAHRLDDAFREEGMEVWVDYEDIPLSVDWWQEIEAGIEGANVFVFIISPDSVMSDICRQEIDHALRHNKRFIPVLHRELDKDAHGDNVHPAVTSHNWLFFRDDDDFDDSFATLIETIEADFNHIRTHTRLLVRAREWESNDHDAAYLLTGSELNDAEAWLAAATAKDPEPTDLQTTYVYESEQARRRRQRLLLSGVSVALVVALGLAALSFVLFQNSERLLSESQRQSTVIAGKNDELEENNQLISRQNDNLIAQSTAIAEGSREISSISLALNAGQNFDEGDTFRALPFALAGFEVKDTRIAERTLADIAYSPGPRDWLFDHENAATDIAAHPAQMLAASASWDDTVRLWNLESGALLHTLAAHTANVNAVSFHPAANRLYSGGADNRVHIWDTDSGDLIDTWQETNEILELVVSHSGRWLMIATPDSVRVRDASSGAVQFQADDSDYFGTGADVTRIALSPDDRQLLIGFENGRVLEWILPPPGSEDTDSIKAPLPFVMYANQPIRAMRFSPDGDSLLLAAFPRLDHLTGDGELLNEFIGHTNVVTDVAFLADGETALSVSHDRKLIQWEIEDADVLRVQSGHQGLPLSMAVSHDGLRALSGSNNGSLILWDTTSDALQTIFSGAADVVQGVAVDAASDRALTIDAAGNVRLWNLADSTSDALGQHSGEGFDVVFLHDSDTDEASGAISAGADGLYYWNLSDWSDNPVRLDGHSGAIFDMALSDDGTRLLSAGNDSNVVLWDTTTLQPLQMYTELSDFRVLAVDFAGDGTAFMASNARLNQFDLDSGQLIREYTGHRDSVLAMDVSPDGQSLLTGDIMGRLLLWDVESTDIIHDMEHVSGIWSATFNPSGDVIAAGEANGTTRTWDTASGEEIRSYRSSRARVRGLAFAPDGSRLLIGADNLIAVRLFEADELVQWVTENRLAEYLSCSVRDEFQVEPLCTDVEQKTVESGTHRAGLALAQTHLWFYDGQAGETISVSMNAENPSDGVDNSYEVRERGLLNARLIIRNSKGVVLAQSNELDRDNTDAEVRLTLPDDDTYTIEAGSLRRASAGAYNLVIRSAYAGNPPANAEADAGSSGASGASDE
jgi:WD40 repeat protein